tara:strand:- start:588 stop:875 length:288 start_codon:yes stop_codon:yes gene_type:complete
MIDIDDMNAALKDTREASKYLLEQSIDVLKGLTSGELALPDAAERSNAIGKANGAVAGMQKAELLRLMLGKQMSKQLGIAQDDQDGGKEKRGGLK